MTHLEEYCKKYPGNKAGAYCVCHRCGLVFGHFVSYCPTCPGKMERISYTTYKELFEKTGAAYEWGETKAWDEKQKQIDLNLAKEQKDSLKLPTLVVYWVYRKGKTIPQFEESVSKVGLDKYKDYGPSETWEPDYVEYGFKFDSFTEAYNNTYTKEDGITKFVIPYSRSMLKVL
jgi:hypothetical protein